ncbi:hypothetical protein ACFQ1M_05720 [Sungkyunkwania multivorans]|uniref:Knr4/Smi1-like domain-containing protein n=1 Tax=Sungkyunkwania multivorans TaxID=1173618 RepID=A0ABW3CVA0_9FLAO
MNYTELFNGTKDRLKKANAKFESEETELAFTLGERTHYEKEFDFRIPDDLFDLYSSYNGLEFNWSIQDNGEVVAGYFAFSHFLDLLDNDSEGKLWVDWYEPNDIEEIKAHRIFETLIGSDYYVTIKIEPDGAYQLFYVPEGSVNHGGSKKLSKIPLTIDEYFKAITGYYGVYSIRHNLHKQEFYEDASKFIPEMERLRRLIPDFQQPKLSPKF